MPNQEWNKIKIEVRKGEKSSPSYRRNIPIFIKNNCVIIYKDKNKYFANIKILSKKGVQSGLHNKTSIDVQLEVKDNSIKQIIDCINKKEYKQSMCMMIFNERKGEYFLNLGYSFDPKKYDKLEEGNIMGIDLGINCPAYMAFNNSQNSYHIAGKEIENFSKKVHQRRNDILRQRKYCGDGSIGHGRNTRVKPVEILNDRISNFRETCNHKYSRYIIELAKKHKCATIQMENLTGVSKDNMYLKTWSYYDLQSNIKYKAEREGIQVKLIDRAYTSQRCSNCGLIHKDSRPKGTKGQAYFKCVACEYETNADYNAAKNISLPDIEKIIEEQIFFQIQTELLKLGFKKERDSFINNLGIIVSVEKSKTNKAEEKNDEEQNKKWVISHPHIKSKTTKYKNIQLIDYVKVVISRVEEISHKMVYEYA